MKEDLKFPPPQNPTFIGDFNKGFTVYMKKVFNPNLRKTLHSLKTLIRDLRVI